MFHADWNVPEYNPKLAQDLLKQANYKGDPIPYRLLNNYYTNQTATAQMLVEMWRAVGLNVQIETKENWTQIMERDADARQCATGRIPRRSTIRCPRSSPSTDRTASSSRSANGPTPKLNKLSEFLETSTDRAARKTAFRRMLEICEREDPAYTVLHQNATFTAKPKSHQVEGVARPSPWISAPDNFEV